MASHRIQVTDFGVAAGLGREVVMGSAFAFFGERFFAHTAASWIAALTGAAANRPKVISLLGPAPVSLPGATAYPVALRSLRLASITSDKAIYRAGRDTVQLLVLDLLLPGAEVDLEVTCDGVEVARRPVRLDACGAAAIELRDLGTGAYDVRFAGSDAAPGGKDAEPACSFEVAEYKLAPLVASLVERRLDGSTLSFELRVESFGRPAHGVVRLELTDRGARVAQTAASAQDGTVRSSFALTGEGPHAINLQLASDARKTATVPLVGSRAEDRQEVVFSRLGAEVTGSLLPAEGSREVRGIFLTEGGMHTTPFAVERVDERTARLVARVPAESVRVVVVDPRIPVAKASALDPKTAPFPGNDDPDYALGEEAFRGGRYDEALALFRRGRARAGAASPGRPPHPFYAYYEACCLARKGDAQPACAALQAALADGWHDLAHLAADEDLAALRELPEFRAIAAGGRREIERDAMAAGDAIEIAVEGPLAVLAVGAFVGDAPWEGWATVVAPDTVRVRVALPATCAPGQDVEVRVEVHVEDERESHGRSAVYVVVKDARLLATDTPSSRLAGRMKRVAEGAAQALAVARPASSLHDLLPIPPPPVAPMAAAAGGFAGAIAQGRERGGLFRARSAAPLGARTSAAAPPAAPAPAAAAAPASPYRVSAKSEAEAAPRAAVADDPEVLFAGLLPVVDGVASTVVHLGPQVADYVVDAFVVAGGDWAAASTTAHAEKDPFVHLDVPLFVHARDAAVGRVQAGSRSEGMRVRVWRDGVELALRRGGRPLAAGEAIAESRAELTFVAGPGEYAAEVEDVATGLRDRVERRVEEPGKLRRIARSLRLLEPGQRVSRDEDPQIVSLRVLQGLEQPLRVLCDATADYGHACCEQTAAKLLAACAMYAFAGDDRRRRERAEAIVLAGVRREKSMWLQGRGFKIYPESSNDPDRYWGAKAARHLWNLALLADLRGDATPGRALAVSIDEGLAMARDATKAYGLAWPPRDVATCEDAYAALRFGAGETDARVAARAVDFVRSRRDATGGGGAVAVRSERAYAAAVLLRAGSIAPALAHANAVVREIGPEGRLYSTVDSVAAIAMMAELQVARVVTGSGQVAVDGERVSSRDAAGRTADLREIAAVDGVVPVEVARVVEESWEAFGAGLPARIALEREGRPTRSLVLGDAVDLRVTLEQGYKPGDHFWVCLPDALSRIVGGGQVKRFSVDFEGKAEARVSLAATGVTVDASGRSAPQRFAVCIRNMFEEERAASPGLVEVTVTAPS
jgi:hypothetical protein